MTAQRPMILAAVLTIAPSLALAQTPSASPPPAKTAAQALAQAAPPTFEGRPIKVYLRAGLKTHAAGERTHTAEHLADIAEVDERRLYVPAGYSSMHAYCVGELHLTEDAAYKRIQVARAGRKLSRSPRTGSI